jgi:FKBP-type peptidyl-prolyl cis-trans isomerase
MKKTLSIIFLFTALLSSCEKSSNYSAQIEQERKKIKEYIENNGITVIYNFSDNIAKDSVCNFETPSNTYYSLGEDSIYFRILSVGQKKSKVKPYDRVQIRYIGSTLDGTNVESYWGTMDLPYPIELIFGNIPTSSTLTNSNCAGWQSAIGMMKYSETIAEIIVPSKLGTYTNYNSVTPYHYKLMFRLLPR